MTIGTAVSDTVRTTCPYCGVGCGVTVRRDGAGGVVVAGDKQHPANFGRLCSKGSALGETLALDTRLLHPEIAGTRVTWPVALDHVAERLAEIRAAHGPQAIAFYLSGQLLTEDYYVANKLAKGFIGTPHVDTNSRLCMASSVAGHRRAFGADVVPQSYDDLELADLVVLAGSNAAWCHPVLYQRIQVARAERGMRVVNIDPRVTATSEGVDLQLSLRPGSDSVLWNGLLVHLADAHRLDHAFIRAHTQGFEVALARAREVAPSMEAVAVATGLDVVDLAVFYGWWTTGRNVVSCYSQGINQSVAGTDKVNAILNCHLATGRIGKPGCGPLSLTGQPNAMGGREVGGLANMLAAHMGFSEVERDRVARFWSAPNIVDGEGLKAVQMFEAIEAGRIKALWVIGTNPAVSLPRGTQVRAALAGLDLLVVSENVRETDTSALAHVRLPAHAWSEKDGTVTNSERRVSRQRGFATAAGDARPDWWILSQVAGRLGYGEAFAYASPAAIFREHARLSGFENDGTRAFDISALSDLADDGYDGLEPMQWPIDAARPSGTERMFTAGDFFTPDRRARFVAVGSTCAAEGAFVLNTGRIRDQWHTMTRTGLSPRLLAHISEPYVEIHPDDAAPLGLEQGTIAIVETAHGRARLRVLVSRGQRRGSLFVPIHWSRINSSDGGVGVLVHGVTDPVSGQPDSKATAARIAAAAMSHYGVLLTRQGVPREAFAYWADATMVGGRVVTFALDPSVSDLEALAARILPAGDTLTFTDNTLGAYRAVVLQEGRVQAILFIARSPKLPSIEWLKSQFDSPIAGGDMRRALLAGRAHDVAAGDGPIICVCFQIGSGRIGDVIAAGATSTEQVGAACGAGTNCGSCLPELKRLLKSREVAHG